MEGGRGKAREWQALALHNRDRRRQVRPGRSERAGLNHTVDCFLQTICSLRGEGAAEKEHIVGFRPARCYHPSLVLGA